jgi:hypothetical protein
VELLPAAQKDLASLRPWGAKVLELLAALETDPFKGDRLAGSLKDSRALKFNLQGSGAYRAAYVITGQTCVVYYIGTRENAYAEIARRAKRVLRNLDP